MNRIKPHFKTRRAALNWMSTVYYPSNHWQNLRLKVLKKHPICEECRIRRAIQVHHRCYDRLWEELPSDLTAVCIPCHKEIEHNKYLERVKHAKKIGVDKGGMKRKTTSYLKKVVHSLGINC